MLTGILVQCAAAGRYLYYTAPPLHFSLISSQDLEDLSVQFPLSALCHSSCSPCSLPVSTCASVLQAQQWLHNTNCIFGGTRQATGTAHCWDCVLMATNFLCRVIKKTGVAFYPPIDLHPKGHQRRGVPQRYNNTVACFCLCSCEVNILLFHWRRANLILPLCSLSSGAKPAACG